MKQDDSSRKSSTRMDRILSKARTLGRFSIEAASFALGLRHYCWLCHNLNVDSPFVIEKGRTYGDRNRLFLMCTSGELQVTSQSGCRFCNLLVEVVQYFSAGSSSMSDSFTIILALGATPKILFSREGVRIIVELYAPLDFPLAWKYLYSRRDIDPNPTSEESMFFLKNWLARCHEEHELCKHISPTLPKRVVDVGLFTDLIKLVETDQGSTGRYVAFSHCWGTCPAFKTTKSNIAARKTLIEESSLPKSFKDAIFLTRILGLQYIWIDSLCIIQDEPLDWDVESAKMASIYEQSYLTIAGSSSPSSDQSFLDRKDNTMWKPLEMKFPDDSGQVAIVKARFIPRTGIHESFRVGRDPWDMRAWTLQEKLLSTRLVSYSGHEMQLSCKTLSTCECEVRSDFELSHPQCPKSTFSLENNSDALLFWRLQVMEYSQRCLTNPNDKLPAISGLASRIQQVTGAEYVAGLWKISFVRDLIWYSAEFGDNYYDHEIISRDYSPKLKRPPSYRAPTFSWASVDGSITYDESFSRKRQKYHTTVLETSCKLSGTGRFGQIESCSAKVHGPCLQTTLTIRDHFSPYYVAVGTTVHDFVPDVVREELAQCDSTSNSLGFKHHRYLPVCVLALESYDYKERRGDSSIRFWSCLVLVQSPKDFNAFERLGFLRLRCDTIAPSDGAQSFSYSTITLL